MSDLSARLAGYARLASYLSSLAQFRVTADRTLSNIYELTVTVTGNGVGSVRRDPDRINFMYKKDELVSVTAIAQDGSKFVRWTGDLSGTHFDYNIKMDGPKSITAEFEKIALGTKSQLLSNCVNEPAKKSFTLNVTITGSGSGTISRTPHSEGYEKGQVVLLVANADPGSKFVGWKGDLQSGHRACNLRMNSDTSVSAEFARVMDGPTLHRAELVESEARTSRLTVASQDASGKPIGHSLHFMDHGDGTVTDTRSGLMWMRPAFGQRWENGTCSGVAEALRLIEVKATPCDFAGYLDWRLPTIDELKGLIYPGKNPALDEQAFPAQSGRYFWTSSCQDDGSTASSGHPIIFALRAGVLGYCVSNSSREHVRFVRKDSSSDTLKIGITQGESEPVIQSPNRLTVFPASSGEPALKPACNPVQRIGHSLHFMDHGDGTVTDTRSGLMWMRPAFGQRWENNSSTGDAKTMSLVEAKTLRCDFAGHKDWRLPTIAELKGLIYPGINPALDDQAFPMQSGRYFWTTSCKDDTSKISSGHPIIFALRTGSLGYSVLEHSHENVRLVRKDSSPDTLTIGIPQGESEPIMQSPNRFTSLPALSGEPVLQPVSNQVKHIGFEGRFIDHCDGTVTDTRSGLMWRRCARGQTWHGSTCSGSAPYLNLVDGAKLNPSFAGYDDWRLPELTELKTLISQTGLTIDDAEVFPNMRPGNYWTSSPNKAGQAWQVDFATGKAYASPLTSLAYVRLVRISHNVTMSGTGNGFVTRTADFSSPTSVTLTAQAAVGSKFKEWHGDANGTNPVCVLTSDSVKSVDAEFVPAESFSLSATTIGTGAGRVTWFPEIEKYVEGSEVSLTAEASEGSKFTGWQGDASGQNAIYSLTMDSAKSVSAEFTELEFFRLEVTTIGTGSGLITQSLLAEKYIVGTTVTLAAHVYEGSKFKCWHGDATGHSATCTVTMDAAKTVSAEFVEIEAFVLKVMSTGTGSGTITRSLDAEKYIGGTPVTLTACAGVGSKFNGWDGDATGDSVTCKVTMDSVKEISAEFTKLKFFRLGVFTTGSGKGVIYLQDPDAEKYIEGSVVTLTAEAANGSEFKRWSGSASGSDSTCTVTMDAAKTVTAEFVQLESFALDVSATGTGSGRVTRSVDRRRYFLGSTVTLTAQADEGSIFTGWHGDAGGLDDACTVTINSKTSVTAEFEKVVVADFGVSVEFESAQDATMKDGSTATIFYLLIRNKGGKQIRITLPMATYQNRLGEEIEQSFWLTGLVIGGNGSTIRAGAFRKTGLGFHKSQLESMSKGDRLHVSVDQSKSSSTLCFTFKCIDADKPFVLVNASSEGKDEPADGVETLPAMTELLVRIESLEESLADVLRRFDELQSSRPPAVHNPTSQPAAPAPTFADVLAWLATQDRMTVAQLRVRLLPLDLLPGAVINEINERALDLMGELALEEAEDEIVVAKEILDEVLANWAHD